MQKEYAYKVWIGKHWWQDNFKTEEEAREEGERMKPWVDSTAPVLVEKYEIERNKEYYRIMNHSTADFPVTKPDHVEALKEEFFSLVENRNLISK